MSIRYIYVPAASCATHGTETSNTRLIDETGVVWIAATSPATGWVHDTTSTGGGGATPGDGGVDLSSLQQAIADMQVDISNKADATATTALFALKAGIAGHFFGTGILPLLKAHGRTVFPNLSGTDLAPLVRNALATIGNGEVLMIPPVINLDGSSGYYVWNSTVEFLQPVCLEGTSHKGGNPENAGNTPSATTIRVASGVLAMRWGNYTHGAIFAGSSIKQLTWISADGTGAVLHNLEMSHCTFRDLNISGFITGLPSAFTGSMGSTTIDGNATPTLTVTSMSSNRLVRGSTVTGAGVLPNTKIDDYLNGATGGVGVYSLLVDGVTTFQTVSSRAMTGETPGVIHLENFAGSAAGQYSGFQTCHFHNNYRSVTGHGYNGVSFDEDCYFDPGNNGSVMAGSIGIRNIGGDTWKYIGTRFQGCDISIDEGGQYALIMGIRNEIFGSYGLILRGDYQQVPPGSSWNAHLSNKASSRPIWIKPTARRTVIGRQSYGDCHPDPVLDEGQGTIREDGWSFSTVVVPTPGITTSLGVNDESKLFKNPIIFSVAVDGGMVGSQSFCRKLKLTNNGPSLDAGSAGTNSWFLKIWLNRPDGSTATLLQQDLGGVGWPHGTSISVADDGNVVNAGASYHFAAFIEGTPKYNGRITYGANDSVGEAIAFGPITASGILVPCYD